MALAPVVATSGLLRYNLPMHPTIDLPGWTPVLFNDKSELAAALEGKELFESSDGRRIFNAHYEDGTPCYGAFVLDASPKA